MKRLPKFVFTILITLTILCLIRTNSFAQKERRFRFAANVFCTKRRSSPFWGSHEWAISTGGMARRLPVSWQWVNHDTIEECGWLLTHISALPFPWKRRCPAINTLSHKQWTIVREPPFSPHSTPPLTKAVQVLRACQMLWAVPHQAGWLPLPCDTSTAKLFTFII